ncbi:hypothetical protein NQ315_010571 [Exocentrus adspersus]|uniref:LKB1 serine/threonine kinase interacting protein 1 N-terminal domain-containing protein n=1 Tax=Exocentrus adspersus TaxID=1586481 RepID=A0AAV8W4X7_9CUCU|nr:hypothetical protein NQ315_010571 [Exocentrus adspersus]
MICLKMNTISYVANLLKPVSTEVFTGKGKLCLSTDYLNKLNSAFELNISEENSSSFHRIQTSNKKNNYIRDLQFLLDLVQKTLSLKIIPDGAVSSGVDISRFKNIKELEIQKININNITGLQKVRPQLQELTCLHSINCLTDVLDKCGGDNSQRYSWNELRRAKFSHNDIVEIDDCVDSMILLQSLDLSHNQINKVDFINQLPNLKYLNISYNKLDKIPTFKGQICSRLQVLILKHNFIEELGGLTSLFNLVQLDISHNCLLEHKKLLSVSHLISLQWLNLQGNPISYHPQHRNLSCNYLNKNSSTLKFVLDNIPLSKIEKGLTGSLYPIFQTSNLSLLSSSSDELSNEALQDKARKIRNVTIEDDNAVKQETPFMATPSTSFQHLELKRQVEQLREEYGESWLYQSGILVQDALGLQNPSIVSSTPCHGAVDTVNFENQMKNESTGSFADFETADSMLISTEKEDNFQSANEDPLLFHNVVQTQDDNISDISDGEDICYGGEESIYLVTNVNDQEQVFVVLTKTHISERDVTTGKEKARWHVNTISSCVKLVDDQNIIKIEFDTLRRDRKQRIYEFESTEIQNFYSSLQEEIMDAKKSVAETIYQCMKCSELFPEHNKNALLEEPSVTCPKCKSNLVVENI